MKDLCKGAADYDMGLLNPQTLQLSQTAQSRVGKRHTTANLAIKLGQTSHHTLILQLFFDTLQTLRTTTVTMFSHSVFDC